jgi:predicted transcriptional regulator YheO
VKEPRLDLDSLHPLVDGLAATFGATCEVVLHDFRKPDASIVAIAGSVTSRHVGGAMSEIGLGLVSRGEDAEDKLNYVTRTPDGRVVKASTIVLRDTEGSVVGALCVNLDITGLRLAAAALGDLIGETGPAPATTVFSDDIAEVIRTVIEQEEARIGRTLHHDSRQGRLEVIKALDGRGVFSLPRAANEVADLLGVSRATVYADLNTTREFEVRR